MKDKNVKISWVICILFILPNLIEAQWKDLSGAKASTTIALAVWNTDLFIGTEINGIYLTTDNGVTWGWVNSGLFSSTITTYGITALYSHGDNIYAGIKTGGLGNHSLYYTHRNELIWHEMSSNLPNGDVWSIAIADTFIFASINSKGVYRSTNNGDSWTEVNTGLPNWYIPSLKVIGSSIFAGTGVGVYRSTNYGITWESLGIAGYVDNMYVRDSILFVPTSNGILQSSDMGNSFINIGPNIGVSAITGDKTNIFAGSGNRNGVYHSTDNGQNWIKAGLAGEIVKALQMIDTNLFAATYNSIYLTSNHGKDWKHITPKLWESTITALGTINNIVFAGTSYKGLYYSTDGGIFWNYDSGLTFQSITSFATIGTNIFASTKNYGVFRSSDFGKSWKDVNNGLLCTDVNSLAVRDSDLFAATNGGGVYKSSNYGSNWTVSNIGLTNTYIHQVVAHGQVLIAKSTNGLFRSFDDGLSWWPYNDIFSAFCSVDDSHLLASSNGYLYQTSDNGFTWNVISTEESITAINIHAFALHDPGTSRKIVAGVGQEGVCSSSDNGYTWKDYSDGLGSKGLYKIVISNSYVFVSSYNKIWRRPLPDFSTYINKHKNDFSNKFALRQNYPNPFNSTTRINFSIPTSTFTTLKIYDLLGREVQTLISNYVNAGENSIEWNAASFPSGLYFYRLQSGNWSETKNIVLIK